MRFFYRLYAYLWLQLRFRLTFFGVTQRLSIDDVRQCFLNFIIGGPTHACLKAWIIAWYAEMHDCEAFVETGTNWGQTLAAVAPLFEACASIEIDPVMIAVSRRTLRRHEHVRIIEGDSAIMLGRALKIIYAHLQEPPARALLWIDAHAEHTSTKPSPIRAELETILTYAHYPLTVLIDDAGFLKITMDEMDQFRDRMAEKGYTATLEAGIWRFTR